MPHTLKCYRRAEENGEYNANPDKMFAHVDSKVSAHFDRECNLTLNSSNASVAQQADSNDKLLRASNLSAAKASAGEHDTVKPAPTAHMCRHLWRTYVATYGAHMLQCTAQLDLCNLSRGAPSSWIASFLITDNQPSSHH